MVARTADAPRDHPRQVAAAARIRARRADVAQADRAFYPDFEVMASYDSMWDLWQHRWMIGAVGEPALMRVLATCSGKRFDL